MLKVKNGVKFVITKFCFIVCLIFMLNIMLSGALATEVLPWLVLKYLELFEYIPGDIKYFVAFIVIVLTIISMVVYMYVGEDSGKFSELSGL